MTAPQSYYWASEVGAESRCAFCGRRIVKRSVGTTLAGPELIRWAPASGRAALECRAAGRRHRYCSPSLDGGQR